VQTPRFCGHFFRCAEALRFSIWVRPLRISWLMVGILPVSFTPGSRDRGRCLLAALARANETISRLLLPATGPVVNTDQREPPCTTAPPVPATRPAPPAALHR
jgi:hypothetical protein